MTDANIFGLCAHEQSARFLIDASRLRYKQERSPDTYAIYPERQDLSNVFGSAKPALRGNPRRRRRRENSLHREGRCIVPRNTRIRELRNHRARGFEKFFALFDKFPDNIEQQLFRFKKRMTATIHARFNAVFVNFQALLCQIAALNERRTIIRNFQDNLLFRRSCTRPVKVLALCNLFEDGQVHARAEHKRARHLRSGKAANGIKRSLVMIQADHDVCLDFARFHFLGECSLGSNAGKPRLCKNAIVFHAESRIQREHQEIKVLVATAIKAARTKTRKLTFYFVCNKIQIRTDAANASCLRRTQVKPQAFCISHAVFFEEAIIHKRNHRRDSQMRYTNRRVRRIANAHHRDVNFVNHNPRKPREYPKCESNSNIKNNWILQSLRSFRMTSAE